MGIEQNQERSTGKAEIYLFILHARREGQADSDIHLLGTNTATGTTKHVGRGGKFDLQGNITVLGASQSYALAIIHKHVIRSQPFCSPMQSLPHFTVWTRLLFCPRVPCIRTKINTCV
jgi:hypothetical protein